MNDTLHQLLDKLKLRGMAASLDEALATAEREGQPVQDVLQSLLQAQWEHSQTRLLENRIKKADLPWDWTLDTFPFKEQPCINRSQINSLAKLSFIERKENLIFIGEPGTGKSGLAIGLLRRALLNGYRGAFYKAQKLLDDLYASLADRSTSKLLKKLGNYDILVIDELGYLNLNREQINSFFMLIH